MSRLSLPVLLPGDSGLGPVDEDAVLVDDVDDGGDLALAGAVLQHRDAADLNELLERLEKKEAKGREQRLEVAALSGTQKLARQTFAPLSCTRKISFGLPRRPLYISTQRSQTSAK